MAVETITVFSIKLGFSIGETTTALDLPSFASCFGATTASDFPVLKMIKKRIS